MLARAMPVPFASIFATSGGRWKRRAESGGSHPLPTRSTLSTKPSWNWRKKGGVTARHRRFCENQALVAEGMTALGFRLLVSPRWQSPVITTFLYPDDLQGFDFPTFYRWMKQYGFLIYPGKLTQAETFRIGNIGQVDALKLGRFLEAVEKSLFRFRDRSNTPLDGERREIE